ncbi:MAG: pyridoxal phosphate-dependent aminotransferase [Bacillota bacterium]|nr:pyridoxal phosphate-dependent aminotransferase [Bacillota bacterium]
MDKSLLAERMSRLGTESAFAILAEANKLEAEGKSIVHMEVGQPDFKTPQNIIDAACKALNDGFTGYGPSAGLPVLREEIARYAKEYKNVDTNADEIVVVPGGKPIMFFVIMALCDHGDEVIYPNPGFPIYESVINFCGGKAVPMPLLAKNGFRIDYDLLEESITDKTKLLIINNPSNPTGAAFSKAEIERLAEIVKKHPKLMVLSDEIYDRLSYGEPIVSIASLDGMKDRTIILDGFSKTYSMTGWRIGYGIMDKDLAEQVTQLMTNSNSCTATFTQIAALEALRGPQNSVEAMKAEFKERRDYIVEALNKIDGVTCHCPEGAFYVFPDISSFGIKSKEFCTRLMHEAGIAAAWGTSFGSFGEGCIRFSYATSLENIKEAVKRFEAFTKTL